MSPSAAGIVVFPASCGSQVRYAQFGSQVSMKTGLTAPVRSLSPQLLLTAGASFVHILHRRNLKPRALLL